MCLEPSHSSRTTVSDCIGPDMVSCTWHAQTHTQRSRRRLQWPITIQWRFWQCSLYVQLIPMLIPAVQPDYVSTGLANLTTNKTQQLITPIVSFGTPACAGTGLRFDRINYLTEFLPISYIGRRHCVPPLHPAPLRCAFPGCSFAATVLLCLRF